MAPDEGVPPAASSAGPAGGAARQVLAAVQFLTRIPVPMTWNAGVTGGAAFGLVGAAVGVMGAIPLVVLGERAAFVAAVLAVGALALVSGALHLDGLSDTADALAAPSPEAADRARRDPRVGAAGAAAIGVALLVDAALLASIAELGGPIVVGLACVAAASGSRAVAPAAAWLARVARPGPALDSGLGNWFVNRSGPHAAAIAVGTAVTISTGATLAVGRPALVVGLLGGLLIALVVAAWLRWVRGRLDGDAFGFLIEVAFAATLLVTLVAL